MLAISINQKLYWKNAHRVRQKKVNKCELYCAKTT